MPTFHAMRALAGLLGLVFVLGPVLVYLPVLWFGLALRTVRVSRGSLEGLDAVPSAVSAGLSLALAVTLAAGYRAPCLAVYLAVASLLVLPRSCRVRAQRTAGTIRRTVLWVIPWRTLRDVEPSLHLDGWGDFDDPLALHLACRTESIELGWVLRGDGARVDAMIAEWAAPPSPSR